MDLWVSLGNISLLLVSEVVFRGGKAPGRAEALVKSAHVPAQLAGPGSRGPALPALPCSALRRRNMKYAICTGHKEHMDHPSQYPPARILKKKRKKKEKIIKPKTRRLAVAT